MFVAIFIKISPYFFQYQTYGTAVNAIMSDGNLENCFLFQGRDTGHEVTVKRVVRVYPIPQAHRLDVCVSVVSSPGGVWGGAPSSNDFGRFVRFYACMQYASIIPGRQAVNLVYRDNGTG